MPRIRVFATTIGSRFASAFLLLNLALAAFVPRALADETAGLPSWLNLSGFGTLGLVHDSHERAHPQRDFTQPDTFEGHWSWRMDSLLGLQVNAALGERLEAAVQVVLNEQVVKNLDTSLEWAFLKWQATEGLALRAGRLGMDFYLLSDYRNVSFAYLWERPPIEFYGPLLLHNFDGADLSYRVPLARGVLQARLFRGEAKENISLATRLGADTLVLSGLWGASLTYESERWRLKAGLARFHFGDSLHTIEDLGLFEGLDDQAVQAAWPEAARHGAELPMAGRDIGFYALGADYDDTKWLVSGEVGYLTSEWRPLRDTLSAYLSIGRRLGNLTPYLVLATASPLEREARVAAPVPAALADPTLVTLHEGTLDLYNAANLDQHSLSLGVRWLVRPNLALKLQWDHTEMERLALWWAGGVRVQDTSAELLSASLSWVF